MPTRPTFMLYVTAGLTFIGFAQVYLLSYLLIALLS